MDSSSIVSDVTETATQAGGGFLSELKKIGQAAASQITGSSGAPAPPKPAPSDFSPTGEVLKFGRTITSQVISGENPSDAELAAMVKKDKELSAVGSAQVIAQIYREYQKRQKQKKQAKEQQEEQFEEAKEEQKEKVEGARKDEGVNPAIAKTNPEIKNYGAE